MPFDAALAVRLGSALLWVLTGAWIVWKGGRHNRWLGIAIFFTFSAYIVNNLYVDYIAGAAWPSPYGAAWGAAVGILGIAATSLVLAQWTRRDWPRSLWPLLAVLAVVVVGSIVLWRDGAFAAGAITKSFEDAGTPRPLALALSFIRNGFQSALLLAVYVSVAVAVEPSPKRAKRQAPLALGVGLFAVYDRFVGIVYPANNDALLVTAVCGVLALLWTAWFWAALRGAGRRALVAALCFLAAAFAGLLVPLLAHMSAYDAAYGSDPTSARGIVRTIGWGIFVYGILRTDMLGIGLRPATVKRGTVAVASLAALFIVAQVMQNFLSAQYGLLTGGVIAGAVLFAANPIQRAVERVANPHSPGRGGKPTDEAYRGALRVAIQGRRLSRQEEAALAEVAERLGIGARRAAEIRHDVEQEKGVA